MRYDTLDSFLQRGAPKGPAAVVMAEDEVEVASTLRHCLNAGFATVILLAPDEIALDEETEALVHRVRFDIHIEHALVGAVNRLIAAAPNVWFHYCFNAEYLFHPFCETRSVRELIAFHAEERRDAFLTYVIDLYAGDLHRFPLAVSLEEALLDRSGYYALGRPDPENHGNPRERQLDFFGGLRWRFEEHVPVARRKIDRIALFRAKEGLVLNADFTFNDQEYNTYSCPWHHNATIALCSFRTAKALKRNPASRYQVADMRWHNSVEFRWHSQQLMDLGLMEPGQWV